MNLRLLGYLRSYQAIRALIVYRYLYEIYKNYRETLYQPESSFSYLAAWDNQNIKKNEQGGDTIKQKTATGVENFSLENSPGLEQPESPNCIGFEAVLNYDLRPINLYYFRARYYDPIMGRFLSVDPMGYQDSMNLYQAFNMNPVNFVDPFGEWSELNHDISIAAAYLFDLGQGKWKPNYFARKNKISIDQVRLIVTWNNIFDLRTQAPGFEYLHAMLAEGEKKEEGIYKRNVFKNLMLRLIYTSRHERSKRGDNALWNENELILFSFLQHAYVDETCPVHNWMVWHGYGAVGELINHAYGDMNMSYSQMEENVRIIQGLFRQASLKGRYDEEDSFKNVGKDVNDIFKYMEMVAKGRISGFSKLERKIADLLIRIINKNKNREIEKLDFRLLLQPQYFNPFDINYY